MDLDTAATKFDAPRSQRQPQLAPSSLPMQPNAVSMQAPMGPQGGGLPRTSQPMQDIPEGLPVGMQMNGPQEWEWLTMSL